MQENITVLNLYRQTGDARQEVDTSRMWFLVLSEGRLTLNLSCTRFIDSIISMIGLYLEYIVNVGLTLFKVHEGP
jgi:hypothetical protein